MTWRDQRPESSSGGMKERTIPLVDWSTTKTVGGREVSPLDEEKAQGLQEEFLPSGHESLLSKRTFQGAVKGSASPTSCP